MSRSVTVAWAVGRCGGVVEEEKRAGAVGGQRGERAGDVAEGVDAGPGEQPVVLVPRSLGPLLGVVVAVGDFGVRRGQAV
ncbi:hypothetical protein CD934_06560 [Streptomyces calvus]|uniref:Uncharacterized protein n=1 Tax=Streptomyces calvus TaxID=67282 RepID=A0A514JM13_9ACTN|nr:hypothetical protein CD934_06560 [Streptomyces calvus]